MSKSDFTLMREAVAMKPGLFLADTHFRTPLYSRWLAAKGPERTDPKWDWPTWRDAELAKQSCASRPSLETRAGHASTPLGPLSKRKKRAAA